VNRAKDSLIHGSLRIANRSILLHPDFTVGPGISPGLLRSVGALIARATWDARGLRPVQDDYRQ